MMSRLLDQPEPWDGTNTVSFGDWRFYVLNWVFVTQGQEVSDEIRWAEASTEPVLNMNLTLDQQSRSKKLFGILVTLCKGKHTATVLLLGETREGYEVWRLVCSSEDPRSFPTTLQKVRDVIRFKIDSRLLEWMGSISTFERLVSEANKAAGQVVINDLLMLALLLESVPSILATQIQLQVESTSTYNDIKSVVERYLKAVAKPKVAHKEKPKDMEVDWIKGRGKGDKGGGKDDKKRTCFRCHEEGHIAVHCPNKAASSSSSSSGTSKGDRTTKGGGGKGGKKTSKGKGKGKGRWVKRVHMIGEEGEQETWSEWEWEDEDYEADEDGETTAVGAILVGSITSSSAAASQDVSHSVQEQFNLVSRGSSGVSSSNQGVSRGSSRVSSSNQGVSRGSSVILRGSQDVFRSSSAVSRGSQDVFRSSSTDSRGSIRRAKAVSRGSSVDSRSDQGVSCSSRRHSRGDRS